MNSLLKPDQLAERAAQWGIETEYVDARGRTTTVDRDGLEKIVAALAKIGPETGHAAPTALPPKRSYQGASQDRMWALAVQLYGVSSRRNWGHGDFTDLMALVELAAQFGMAGIGINPLHVLFDDRPQDASPYSPNSRLFLQPWYIDVDAVAEFPGKAAGLADQIAALRAFDQVDYAGVARVKGAALRVAYQNFRTSGSRERRGDFEAFRQQHDTALTRFACFETLRHRFKNVWWEWPEEWRRPTDAALAALQRTSAEEIGFYEYVQWNADRQLGACQARARALGLPLGLYIDLAVGVNDGGADAWADQGAIAKGIAVGAPPDAYNTLGQNWGLAAFNPRGLEATDFKPFRDMLDAAMRHAGAVRLDHVLGLQRLFLIPHGMTPDKGAYVRFPLDRLLTIVSDESHRRHCIVIGEDLGTVPEGFVDTLARWGLWSYRVMMFERDGAGRFKPPEDYAEQALVTFNTHDLPTFAGWESGNDLKIKHGLGIDPGETMDERHQARRALSEALGQGSDPDHQPPRFVDVARYLAATSSRLLVITIEDVLGVKDQPNMPGTVDEHPNWRRRLPVDIEELANSDELHALSRICADAGRSTRNE